MFNPEAGKSEEVSPGEVIPPQTGGVNRHYIEGKSSTDREASLIGKRDAKEIIPELPAGAVEIRVHKAPAGHENKVMVTIESNGELAFSDVEKVNQLRMGLFPDNTFPSMSDALDALR